MLRAIGRLGNRWLLLWPELIGSGMTWHPVQPAKSPGQCWHVKLEHYLPEGVMRFGKRANIDNHNNLTTVRSRKSLVLMGNWFLDLQI